MIVKMTEKYAREIMEWHYENEYSMYNLVDGEEDFKEIMDGTYYAICDEDKALQCFFCFGKDARIPTVEDSPYMGDYIDVGIGTKPELCGKGMGRVFLKMGMEYGKNVLNIKQYRLTVAKFNERAIKTYEKLGFVKLCEVSHKSTKKKFLVMTEKD
ncbi:MAG: GNAT family protein [Oscillospiraceae bacterium]